MQKINSYCGLDCEICEYFTQNKCGGCIATKGKPFHGECRLADCAKSKNRRFCGECGNFPCEILKEFSFDTAHGDGGARIERCKSIKAELVAEARKGVNPVGFCGHHCDYCFMGEFCGGCRSDYNGCSYATLFDGGVCPNLLCAKEKGFDGCYRCPDLLNCKKGYYGLEEKGEYVAKATALFISRYGEEKYGETLKKAIDSGEKYPESFDKTGGVQNALALLEKYL